MFIIGKPIHAFAKKLRALIKNKFIVHKYLLYMHIYFKSFKIDSYFQLKYFTLKSFCQMLCRSFFDREIRQYSIRDTPHNCSK